MIIFINRLFINKDSLRGGIYMADWLTSLITETPQEGFELAITLARKGVGYAQPSAEVRAGLR